MPIAGTPLQLTAVAGIGANNWAIKESAFVQADNLTSKCSFGTDTAVAYILVKPGVTNATRIAAPAAAGQDFGWNILVADIDATANLPADRLIRQGTLTFNCVFVGSVADTATSYGINIRVYKRLVGGSLTLINNAETAGASMSLIAADIDVVVPIAADVVFAPGESLHIEAWVKGKGFAVTGQIVSFKVARNIVAQQDVSIVHNATVAPTGAQGLRYKYNRTHTVTTLGTTALQRRVSMIKTVTLVGVATMTRRIVAARSFAVTVVGTPVMARFVTAYRAFAATMVGLATRQLRVSPAPKAVTITGTPGLQRRIGVFKAVTMVGTPVMLRVVTKTFSVAMVGVAAMGRRLTAMRSFATTVVGTPRLRVELPETALDRMEPGGGGTTIIKVYERFTMRRYP